LSTGNPCGMHHFPVFFLNGCSRMIVSSLRAPVEMIVGFTPHSLQSFST